MAVYHLIWPCPLWLSDIGSVKTNMFHLFFECCKNSDWTVGINDATVTLLWLLCILSKDLFRLTEIDLAQSGRDLERSDYSKPSPCF